MTDRIENRLRNAERVRFEGGRLRLNGRLNQANEFSFYQFRVSSYTDFNCNLNRQEGNVSLTLYNRQGREIAASIEDDGEPESISQKLRAGTYFLGIERVSGHIEYRLRSTVIDAPGTRRQDSLKISSKTFKAGKFKYRGTIDGSEERFNYFRLDVDRTSTFSSIIRELDGDVEYQILDSSKRRVFVSTESSRSVESFDRLLVAGTYYIKIKAKSKQETRYKFNCDLGDPIALEFEEDSTSSSFVYTESVTELSSETYYRVDLSTASNLNLALRNLSADVNLELLSESGSILFQSFNTRRSQELINANLEAGVYFIRVFPGATDELVSCDLDFSYTDVVSGASGNSITLSNGYQITFLGVDYIGDTSIWDYSVTELPEAQDLSNWVLELPSGVQVLSSTPGGELVNPDPNAQISGIKWETSASFTEGIFSVTLADDYSTGLIRVAAKGPDVSRGRLTGPLDCGCSSDDDDDNDDDNDDDD